MKLYSHIPPHITFLALLLTSLFITGKASSHTELTETKTHAAQSVLIPKNSTWKFLDNGSDQGKEWTTLTFDDNAWKSGSGQLGYGDGDEATVVGYGSDANSKHVTTYFRKSFDITDLSGITDLSLSIMRDDGAVVYLNGTEVYRTNMPEGSISYTTEAFTYMDGADESAYHTSSVNISLLVPGKNVIAVEIHQKSKSSSDISFDLSLEAVTSCNSPLQPGAISGNTVVTPGSSSTFSVSPVSGATSYIWALPSGWSGNSTSNTISVIAGTSGGNISVQAANECGTSSTQTLFANIESIPIPETNVTLIPVNSSWKYIDNGSDQGTAWKSLSFDDNSWKSGNAQLGYGDGDEATLIGYGANSSTKYITTYFRKTFDVADASSITFLNLNLLRDDGAVVYLNGTEVYRTNMPAGTVTFSTTASSYIDAAGESECHTAAINHNLIVTGKNILAVEIHQHSGTSSDISFNLSLEATSSCQSPTQPGPISGNTIVSPGSSNTYSVSPVTGATSYDWTLPSGWSGNTISNSISAIAGTVGGTISVQAKNSCGVSTIQSLTVAIETTTTPEANLTLIPANSTWRYMDNGSDQGTAWRSLSFDDNSWKSGSAQFGYGDGDESTVVSFGYNSSGKYTTTYFRKTFDLTDPSAISFLNLSLLRDDGAVVYLNGTEVFRSNMPDGSISYLTTASSYIEAANESEFYTAAIDHSLLLSGKNVIAVEIHQHSGTSSDISFNLSLTASGTCQSPAQPGAINGNVTVSPGSINTYSVSPVSGATSYIWTVPAGWTGNTISNSLSTIAGTTGGTISVKAVNSCGSSAAQTLLVEIVNTTKVQTSLTLIPANSTWKYLDNGSDQGNAWTTLSYNDNSWKTGNAQLGYGDGDETTVVGYGPNSGAKYTTTYFRKSFNVTDPALITSLTLNILRDDGGVIYLNGKEVYRTNMPAGTITYSTPAADYVDGADESSYYTASIDHSLLVTGTNVLAVEIHQRSESSSDISFNLSLISMVPADSDHTDTDPVLLRGPYLQLGTPNSIYIKWRTQNLADSKIKYGTSPNYLNDSVISLSHVRDHELQLTGLQPGTKYYYSIGTSSATLQGNDQNFFITSPSEGVVKKTRIWAIGDAGTGYVQQNQVRDAYYNYTGSTYTDVWLWMGDNAYQYGHDEEYQVKVFTDHYEKMLKQTVAWPTLGNHDYGMKGYKSTASLGTDFAYFDIFTLPENGEAGGVPSGTEKYYSYNYSNIHFICLDSYGSHNQSSSPMASWLKQDLALNTQKWTIVYFHHPPYTKGNHDSDKEIELIDMRNNIVPILEQYNVDLVLSGHSHTYERSFLIEGHLGNESTFTNSMKVNGGSGKLPSPYIKNAPDYDGSVYTVIGCSGKVTGTSPGWPHNAMYYSINTEVGSMVIDVDETSLTARFIDIDQAILDEFTIQKDVYTDQIENVITNSTDKQNSEKALHIYPNPYTEETSISYTLNAPSTVSLELYDLDGKLVQTFVKDARQSSGDYQFSFSKETARYAGGIFYIRLLIDNSVHTEKLIQLK